jgi:hypothetical protein
MNNILYIDYKARTWVQQILFILIKINTDQRGASPSTPSAREQNVTVQVVGSV